MISEGFVDLDELVVLCRDDNTRSNIQEAVRCYKAGAYRQTIVATWIAVVYDIIHKIQELELTGDANAKGILETYEKIRKAGDLNASLKFEKGILDLAKNDFELISELEYIDLDRLQQDRNRCAHPTMNLDDEVYQPSPELARTHLRNAIEHLLQRPPVQGKAALNRLLSELDSEYFPIDPDDAIKYLSVGPLAHPRFSLIRNYAIVLIKTILDPNEDLSKRKRCLAALLASLRLHTADTRKVIAEKLNDIVGHIPDAQLSEVLLFLTKVQDTWQYLAVDSRERLSACVRNPPDGNEARCLNNALKIPELQGIAAEHINDIADEEIFMNLLDRQKGNIHPAVVSKAVDYYIDSGSFVTANSRAQTLVTSVIESLTEHQIEQIVQACDENNQIAGSYEKNKLLRNIRRSLIIPEGQFNQLLTDHHIPDIGEGELEEVE
jgi:hypothetical protein